MPIADIDKIDRAILNEMQHDARISNVEMAARVGLSESACLRRVKTLEASGLVDKSVTLLNQTSCGRPGNVFVQVTLHGQQQDQLSAFEDAVKDVPEVMECYLMSGSQDYMLRVIVTDTTDYERIHTQQLTQLPGVSRVHSAFALRTVLKKTEIPV